MIQIITYVTTDPAAPPAMRCCAVMVSDGRPGSHWQTTAPTEAEARAKLEAIWLRQYPREKRVAVAELMDDLV